jgi:cbb3-type cytochrome oxidase maturation protein
MDVIYLLLSVSVLIALGFLLAFLWSVKKGQYEDVVSPSVRVLYEDTAPTEIENSNSSISTENNKTQ